MIVPDVNLLLYAVDESAAAHVKARSWWLSVLGGTEPVGLAWVTTLAFIRLTTNPRVFESPLTVDQALALVRGWLALPHVVPLEPGDDHLERLHTLLRGTGAGGNLVTDAHLAAIAMAHGAALASADADFTRFGGLRRVNPLA